MKNAKLMLLTLPFHIHMGTFIDLHITVFIISEWKWYVIFNATSPSDENTHYALALDIIGNAHPR